MDYTIILTAAVTVLASSGIWTYLDHRRADRQAARGLDDAERRLIVAIARDCLISRSIEYLRQGWISAEQMDALTELFTPYKELGGDGNAERLYLKAVNLPINNDRTERRDGQKTKEDRGA